MTAVCISYLGNSQVQISGTVYDRSQRFPMANVSVMSTSGKGTVTDSLGKYQIRLSNSDSISFSYLGKSTYKFAVKEIEYPDQFDMSIDVAVDSLPSVLVWPKDYQLDSLENRKEYEKIFDYGGGEYLDRLKGGRGGKMAAGVGFNFDMFFEGKSVRRMEAFQKRLIQEEQDKYVDHRFTRALVKRITGMEAPALDTFMRQYRPSYDFVKSCEMDWEFYKYILESGRFFIDQWKQEHPDIKIQSDSIKNTN
ncbi:MAG: carboxypeptidase-like regulatory domain-containing protein [Bacteroidetes bacterium]|nr:carboxypeptidase-like regulatory domain-containing protein [Bacteroidota bacterium]